jgi:site-specific DNA-methyltransferase (adenine-specific)
VNQLYLGDCLNVLRDYIKDESVDLIYIDPPFNSKRNYNIFFDDKEIQTQRVAFEDTWSYKSVGDSLFELQTIQTEKLYHLLNAYQEVAPQVFPYLVMMTLRILELHRVLKSTGSFYLHCDPTASHYLKTICDAIFNEKNFRNEIIWCYSGGGRPQEDFARKHDVILRYSKTKKLTFNADEVRIEYNLDTSKYSSPKSWGSHKGIDKQYAPNPLGKIPEDWWQLSPINSQSKERLGYPTQSKFK